MLNLKAILHGVKYRCVCGNPDIPVQAVRFDSRLVSKGDLFVAINGYTVNGHSYIDQALRNGAAGIVLQDKSFIPVDKVGTFILVDDSRAALALIAANHYGNPAKKLQLTGITGTNGKSTTAFLIKAVMESSGLQTGLIGTIAYLAGEQQIGSGLSTPDALTIHNMFSEMIARNMDACVMEVTSHSIKQKRVLGLNFKHAVFTNISHDHLDYHETFADYIATKAELFGNLNSASTAILNRDDQYYRMLMNITSAGQTLSYSIHDTKADVYASRMNINDDATIIELNTPCGSMQVSTRLPGDYNCANILAATSTGIAQGIALGSIARGIESVKNVKGRFERVQYGQDFNIIIDYAHSPDALEKVLTTLAARPHNKIITVFGSDGERDKAKRSMMGAIVSRRSDLTILTTDNPRHEDPGKIISEIAEGITTGSVWRKYLDRKQAIHYALSQAVPGDTVLIAGKGHENYQEINDKRNYYDDRDSIREYFKTSE